MSFWVGRSLEMELEVTNPSAQPWTFEEALHTYLRVGDVREIGIDGLDEVEYLDKMDSLKRKRQPAGAIRITGETDRIYLETRGTCTVQDPVLGRTLTVEKENSDSTVVWNPWTTQKLPDDFDPAEYRQMVCVESGNVKQNTLSLGAGQRSALKVVVSSTRAS